LPGNNKAPAPTPARARPPAPAAADAAADPKAVQQANVNKMRAAAEARRRDQGRSGPAVRGAERAAAALREGPHAAAALRAVYRARLGIAADAPPAPAAPLWDPPGDRLSAQAVRRQAEIAAAAVRAAASAAAARTKAFVDAEAERAAFRAARQLERTAVGRWGVDGPRTGIAVGPAPVAAPGVQAALAARILEVEQKCRLKAEEALDGGGGGGQPAPSSGGGEAGEAGTRPPQPQPPLPPTPSPSAAALSTATSSSSSDEEGEEHAGLAPAAAAFDDGSGHAPAAAAGAKKARKPRAATRAGTDAAAAGAGAATSPGLSSPPTPGGEADGGSGDDGAAAPSGIHAEPAGDPPPPYVHIVNTVADARRVAALLMSPAFFAGRLFACDTEVAGIDVARESPCGHGRVICFSIYAGPDVDFGDPSGARGGGGGGGGDAATSPSPPTTPQPQLFVDTMLDGSAASAADAAAIMAAFAPFWASPAHRKVWHNYSFDRHVLENAGLVLSGFDGDTMHMARLWDSSRARGKGYSLESLSKDADLMMAVSGGGGGGGGGGAGGGRAAGAHHPGGAALAAAESATKASGDDSVTRSKTSMKDLFGRPNLKKDGTPGKLVTVPPVEDLQTAASTRGTWVKYAALDAQATFDLRAALEVKLRAAPVEPDAALADGGLAVGAPGFTAWDLYTHYWRPFGELLTDMEAAGVRVDRGHLAEAQVRAEGDREAARSRFRGWAASLVPGAAHMNVNSGPQVRTLLFAGTPDGRPGGEVDEPLARKFKAPNEGGWVEPGKKVAKKNLDLELHGLWGAGVASPLAPPVHTATGRAAVSTPVLRGLAGAPGAALRVLAERGLGLADDDAPPPDPSALADTIFLDDPSGGLDEEGGGGGGGGGALPRLDEDEGDDSAAWASEEDEAAAAYAAANAARPAGARGAPGDAAALAAEAKALGVGTLYAAFGGGTAGLRACAAVDALCEVGAIDTLLSNFIIPLQGPAIATPEARWAAPAGARPRAVVGGSPHSPVSYTTSPTTPLGRVHCSLNINTETGRLSARRPNLQNQPALEKDRYRVRRAFKADTDAGRTLIVADYGQLELRLLAHMANCPSMLAAFAAGGDFHSRTALGMYDHIRAAVGRGEVALEREEGGEPVLTPAGTPPPLLKDVFAAERRRAKVLNFSIAYGKTAHGLARDWGTTVDEAAATVERWYADRPEVQAWQEATRQEARRAGRVRTLLGRTRVLPDALTARNGRPRASARAYQHALRAAINSPIQGSAADVATAAMLSIAACPRLAALGWTLLLQVHDEVILEGPRETVDEAQALVVHHMGHPFEGTNPLRVDLVVDAKHADNWYDAK
jgi:DNA polymerase-1